MKSTDQLANTVKDFARELEAIASGSLYKDSDGEFIIVEDEQDTESLERVYIFDYFDRHALSIKNWKINSNGECVGGEVLLCFGGPTVWVTEEGVFGAWGGDRYEWSLYSAKEVVLEYLSENMPAFNNR